MQTPNKNNLLLEDMSRLQWSCRRGMLELDVLLGNFLKNRYLQCSQEDKVLFIQLLSHSDPELFAWLMGHETPSDEGLIKIIKEIQGNAQSRV